MSFRYMATSALDTQLKIWDIRTYKQLQAYRTVRPASSLAISQRGLLAAGCGPHVQVRW
jgi:U3 small nucleolar RNA-associated protein 7